MPPTVRDLIALNLTTAAFLLGAAVFARSFSGEFALGAGWTARTVAVLAVGLLSAGGWWLAWSERLCKRDPVVRLAFALATVTAPSLIAWVAVSAGASPTGLVFRGLLVAGLTLTVSAATLRALVEDICRELSASSNESVMERENSVSRPRDEIAIAASAELPKVESVSERVQTWSRAVAGGMESIEAEMVVTFAAGERQTTVHVPIQPALPRTPQVECEPVEALDLEIEPELVTPFGIRLRVRRKGPTNQPFQARIAVLISAEAVVTDAA